MVVELLEQAQAVGLVLSVDGDRLKYEGKRTPEAMTVLQEIVKVKADVIAHLTQPEPTSISAVDGTPAEPLPPLRNPTGKPSLPVKMWMNSLTTFAEARQVQQQFSMEYATALGQDRQTGLFYVRCPGWQAVTT